MKDLKSIELPEWMAIVVGNNAKPPFALRKTLPTGWGYLGSADAQTPAEGTPLKEQGEEERQNQPDEPAPFQAGDWVTEAPDSGRPNIAKVKDVYRDDIAK